MEEAALVVHDSCGRFEVGIDGGVEGVVSVHGSFDDGVCGGVVVEGGGEEGVELETPGAAVGFGVDVLVPVVFAGAGFVVKAGSSSSPSVLCSVALGKP